MKNKEFKNGDMIKFRTPDLSFEGNPSIVKEAEFVCYVGNDKKDRLVTIIINGILNLIHEDQTKDIEP